MTILLQGPGGLFTRLGEIFGIFEDINRARGSQFLGPDYLVTIDGKVDALDAEFVNGAQRSDIIDTIYQDLNSWKGANSGFLSRLQQFANNTLIQMTNDDVALVSLTLANAMPILISQMEASADSVQQNVLTVGAQAEISVDQPPADPAIEVSILSNAGKVLQYAFAEDLLFQCTRDAQTGGIAFQETFRAAGSAAASGALNFDWPAGSGSSQTFNAINASLNNTGGQLLVNGDMEVFTTANQADNWNYVAGAAGVDFLESATFFTGASALELVADSVAQDFNQKFATASSVTPGAGGTPATVSPLQVVAVQFWLAAVVGAPGAGVLIYGLWDGTNWIQDDQGIDQNATVDLTSLTTSYVPIKNSFRFPRVIPANVHFRFFLSTGITTNNVLLDRVGFALARQMYAAGPYVQIFSGSKQNVIGDLWTVPITKTYGKFQRNFNRFYSMRTLGQNVILPSSGAPTIPDSLVT